MNSFCVDVTDPFLVAHTVGRNIFLDTKVGFALGSINSYLILKVAHSQKVHCKVASTKGQVNLERTFFFFNSSKKRTKNFCPSRLGQKYEFSSSFFGRIGGTKKTFRN